MLASQLCCICGAMSKSDMPEYAVAEARKYLRRHEGPLKQYFGWQEDRLLLGSLRIKDMKVLDLGCGAGRHEGIFHLRGATSTLACDLSSPMLYIARHHSTFPNTNYVQMNGKSLAVSSNSVDLVVSFGLFECIQDINPIVAEVRRVLKRDGVFVFTSWNANRWYRFSFMDGRQAGSVDHDQELLVETLIKCGFRIEIIESYFFLPRGLFLAIFEGLISDMARTTFVRICNRASDWLRSMRGLKGRGWVLAIYAAVMTLNEMACG